ncbi:hypothetical protein [Paraclostridium sordellii]|uniref:hypothetical protein n=1 Tax=Paraclostridium sordellii TaxID=1505 RepID=UPI0022DE9B2F|nr:hypothetical protein [Paeniclostridium sordellii]
MKILKTEILPMFYNCECEKKLRDKEKVLSSMDSEDVYNYELEYIKFNENSNIDYVIDEYDDSISRKKQFEDKAKSNLIAISISVSIILGLIKPLNEVYDKYNCKIVNIFLMILGVLAVILMLYGGNLSLKVLMEKNIIYKVRKSQLEEEGESLKKVYGMYGELNDINNTIRNNYINTSYKCIRNALIILSVIFIIGIIPYNNSSKEKSEIQKNIDEIRHQIDITYESIIELKENDIRADERYENYNNLIKELEKKAIIQEDLLNDLNGKLKSEK